MDSGNVFGKIFFCFCGFQGSTCCTILSVWAVIMMLCLGGAMRLQAVALYEDIKFDEAHNNATQTEINAVKAYNNASLSCFVAAFIYLAYLAFSGTMMAVNFMRSKSEKRAKSY
ncbi:PREDICTED: ribonuclease kappa-B-like [Amphimedon queenslandica]|uniref:Uncharacterized protein n=1 Tax=Amphimedon queenslandica TaxID=400682 RepID=A0A1X7U3I7_AMPQE|nr:PREDICTED: ribonuclease kappa-B-like [Amphimedon queenslandica]|eukprot:XP_003389080.1 PREDICTED: ribonuclease kappa-B-like [Amphimedon queenslandica]